MSVELRPVDRDNVVSVCRLELAEGQRRFVAPAAYSVAEAAYEPGAVLRAVYEGDGVVGLILAVTEGDVAVPGLPHIVRLMIDQRQQRRGLGRQAVDLFSGELEGEAVTASYVPGEDGPAGFWASCGFEATGQVIDGEPVVQRRRQR